MANQLAVMTWTNHGDEVILSDVCHIVDMENGAIGSLSGVQARTVETETGILKSEDSSFSYIQLNLIFENKKEFILQEPL